jgi:hypothetical protein
MTTPTTIQVRLQLRQDTAANWTAFNPVLLAGELGRESDTGKIKIGTGSTPWSGLAYQPFGGQITNADISATAEIAVSKLADGAARQLLQTDAAGTGVEWASNIDIPGTLDVTGAATFDAAVTVQGDLTVNGTTTTIDTANLAIEDKNIEIGKVTTPTDVTADGGGITLKGTTDKTINWVDATDAWTLSEHVNIASAKEYRIAGTKVLDATSLGSAVVSSSLTSVDTIGAGVWQGTAISKTYLDATLVSTGDTGTVTSTMILDGTIVNADINASAAIVDTKLATISTAGKVSGTAITSGDIATSGDLEITSTTPIVRLAESDGTATHSQTAIVRNSDQLLLQTRSSTGALLSNDYLIPADASGATEHQWRIANTEKARLDSAGLTVVNDLTISDKIIHAGDTDTAIRFPAADTVSVETAGSERLRITSAGLVGIGISVPTAQLHVANVGTNDSFIVEDSGSDATPFRISSSGGVFTGSQLVVGAQETYNDGNSTVGKAQINSTGNNNSRTFSHIHWGGLPRFRHCSTPSTTIGTHTISALNNVIGAHEFYASDGVNFIPSASIQSTVDATPSVGVVPGNLTFSTAPAGTLTERLRIDSSGRLLVGTSSALTNTYVGGTAIAPAAQIDGNSGSASALSITRQTGAAANIILQRGVTGTPVAINHAVGQVNFNGFDGTNFRTAAQITAEVDGTPGVGIVPGRIVFDTANSSGTLTEAMRITSAGDLRFNSGFGSAANAYGCRAWVNFAATGGVITVLGSGNVSSVTRNDAGDHTINFSTAMPDANYAYNVTNGSGFTGHSGVYGTSSLGIVSRAVATGTLGDAGSNHVSVFR